MHFEASVSRLFAIVSWEILLNVQHNDEFQSLCSLHTTKANTHIYPPNCPSYQNTNMQTLIAFNPMYTDHVPIKPNLEIACVQFQINYSIAYFSSYLKTSAVEVIDEV